MVQGIEKFKERFRNYTGQYVFIGGTACDLILGREEIPFRQTKDLDIVLMIEALNKEFIREFSEFILEAGYLHINKGTGENQFYRFEKPTDNRFPYMIELFSRRPDYLSTLDTRLAPVHVNEGIMSLSAILLNEEYYSLLRNGAVEVEGVSVLDLEYLILFKMKAWLDLSERKRQGEAIDSKNIKKHKNDVIRLAIHMQPESHVEIAGQVELDAKTFLAELESEKPDLKNMGIKGITVKEIIDKIKNCYGI